ncbi:MAG: hypothetical protein EOO85_25630 [Pedobacter sp.]|nr:MAG: hypothetical protein EOO85_25630 [Pedobacter sp.]
MASQSSTLHHASDASFASLIEVLDQLIPLSVKLKISLRTVILETSYRKGARILNAGSTQHMLWFMLDGLAREIRVNKDTFEENTSWFWFQKSFLYTTPGFFSRESSESTIELLEDCKMVIINYADLIKLKDAYFETETLIEKVRGGHDSVRQSLADDIRNLATEERYNKHHTMLNNLFGRTQMRYIASYMGMSPDRLGKLRRK